MDIQRPQMYSEPDSRSRQEERFVGMRGGERKHGLRMRKSLLPCFDCRSLLPPQCARQSLSSLQMMHMAQDTTSARPGELIVTQTNHHLQS